MLDLRVQQSGAKLRLSFRLRAGRTPAALWAYDIISGTWHYMLAVPPSLDERHDIVVDLTDLAVPTGENGARLSLAVELTKVLRDGEPRRIALACAKHTVIGPLHLVRWGPDGERTAAPYPNSAGGISIAVDKPLNPYGVVHVQRLVVRRGALHLRGRLSTRHGDLRTAHVVLKARVGGGQIQRVVPVQFDAERAQRRFGHRWYGFEVQVDCRSLLEAPHLRDDTYDIWFRITTAQNPQAFEIRVGRTPLLTRLRTRPGWARSRDRAVAISPYYTFKAKRTSLNVYHVDARTAAYARVMRRLRHIDRLLHIGRQTWLIGERPHQAQDNGYWFFRYVRENHPHLSAYYVIAADSPQRARVEPFGNVVEFGSRRHIRLALHATKVIGTHHPDFLYPMRTREFARAVRATRVFLQHGVMGTKWMANLYGKGAPGFNTDLVIASSEREKEYLVGDFGYRPHEVPVTGLPRFDSLFAGDVPVNPRQLFVMPTWRDWLLDADRYVESEFHKSWSRFLHDPRLRRLSDEHGLEILFCLHPNMQHFRELFADAPGRLIAQDEVDVQMLLKQSAILVTDYSSVGFDFAFLDKPVAYFQFDRLKFLGPAGSHLELDEELPGPVFRSIDGIIQEITRQLAAGCKLEERYRERADRFIAHRDRQSCARAYEAVKGAHRRRRVRNRIARNELLAVLREVVRRSWFYYPAMRRLFALIARLPADQGLVVFESGLGRQYADSPRYLYEELVRQRPDMKKVWSYNGRLHTSDANTVVVRRLSVRYFYYLARAKYWVNNQSFPHYLSRRPRRVFVQTWHGTPLKRMLHDLPETHGRNAGYVQRATRGAQQWSVLVSPNSHTSQRLRSAFRYDGPVLELGYPRNDILHAPDRDQLGARVRDRLGLPPDKRVVLFAPTFRDDQLHRGRFSFNLPFDLERLYDALGADLVLLVRMHVLVANAVEIPLHLQDFARDASAYPETQELFLAADALVTDYSSVFFDYAQLRRPIIFYAYDLDSYRDRLRGFYLDYGNDLPGPIVETEEALIDSLRNLDSIATKYAERLDDFIERFAAHDDGHAAERVVTAIFGARG